MSKRYTEEYKNTIVELYNSGKTLAELNSEYGLPKSTILTWLKKANPIAVDNNKTITQADYQAMLKKMARIEEENEICISYWINAIKSPICILPPSIRFVPNQIIASA